MDSQANLQSKSCLAGQGLGMTCLITIPPSKILQKLGRCKFYELSPVFFIWTVGITFISICKNHNVLAKCARHPIWGALIVSSYAANRSWIQRYGDNRRLPDSIRIMHIIMMSSNGSVFRVTIPLWGEFPSQRSMTRIFSLICALNKRLSKQSWGWWFKTPSLSFWRHRNVDRLGVEYNELNWTYKYRLIETILNSLQIAKVTCH